MLWFSHLRDTRAHTSTPCEARQLTSSLIHGLRWKRWREGSLMRMECRKIPWTQPSGRKETWNGFKERKLSLFCIFMNSHSPLIAALDALLARVSRWMLPCVEFCVEEEEIRTFSSQFRVWTFYICTELRNTTTNCRNKPLNDKQ